MHHGVQQPGTDTIRDGGERPSAGSGEELAQTACVVGYRPGLGSCIGREE